MNYYTATVLYDNGVEKEYGPFEAERKNIDKVVNIAEETYKHRVGGFIRLPHKNGMVVIDMTKVSSFGIVEIPQENSKEAQERKVI